MEPDKNAPQKSTIGLDFAPYDPGPEDNLKIERGFTYHPPLDGSGQAERYQAIRGQLKKTAYFLSQRCPRSRELSLAFTALQDASMWANAAIACNETRDNHPGL